MKVYFISGLGADRRVFKYIRLPENCEPVYLDWIKPLPQESLPEYARRMASLINQQEPYSLIGLSLGGMIAAEISKELQPRKTVLISTAPSSDQIPFYFKWVYTVRAHKLVPVSVLKSGSIVKRFFTAESDSDKALIKKIIWESDPSFIHWAVDAILRWKTNSLPANYVHIHGTRDELLPFRFVRPSHVIRKAGHMMVMTHAKEINQILEEIFSREKG